MPSPLPRQVRWTTCSLVPSHRLRPSPNLRRVGPCIALFEACSAFTHVTAYRLAKSPMRPSAPEASAVLLPPLLLRLLPGGTNQLPGGIFTRCGSAPVHGALRIAGKESVPQKIATTVNVRCPAFVLLEVPEGRHNVAHRGNGGYVWGQRVKPRRGGTERTKCAAPSGLSTIAPLAPLFPRWATFFRP